MISTPTYKENLLSLGSGAFIAIFFTSLIMWVLGNKLGNIYLFSGFVIYYLIDHLIFRKNNSQKLDISINSLIFGLGLILFFQIGLVTGILLAIPAIIYVILSYDKLNKTIILFIIGAILATLILYLKMPFAEALSFISGALFYIVAKYMMFESMDKKLAFVIGLVIGVLPFIVGI